MSRLASFTYLLLTHWRRDCSALPVNWSFDSMGHVGRGAQGSAYADGMPHMHSVSCSMYPAQFALKMQLGSVILTVYADHMWWQEYLDGHPDKIKPGSIYHPHEKAPVCVPCHYTKNTSDLPFPSPPGCPCTPEILCNADVGQGEVTLLQQCLHNWILQNTAMSGYMLDQSSSIGRCGHLQKIA